MNKDIIPENGSNISRQNYLSDIESWKNFAQRITKNPFVKKFLLERDGNSCSWCKGRFITSKVIHHVTYDHFCGYNRVISISSSTPINPHKIRVVPDCERCKSDNNNRFQSCVSKLVLVHNFCNNRIAEKTRAIAGLKL